MVGRTNDIRYRRALTGWRTLSVVLAFALVVELSTAVPAQEEIPGERPRLMQLLPASGVEDAAVPIPIRVDAPAVSEVLLVTIDGVPPGGRLSAGTDDGAGSWSLTHNELGDLSLIPPTDFNGDFELTVTLTAVVNASLPVIVAPVADPPSLEVGAAEGPEDRPVRLSLGASSAQGEPISLAVSGVPNGAKLNAGADDGNGMWALEADQLTDLALIPPADFAGTMELTATAVSRDGTDTAIASAPIPVSVIPVADPPLLTLRDVSGAEDTAVTLLLDATAARQEELALWVDGLPAGASLTAGTDQDGRWLLLPEELPDLQLIPPANFNGPMGLRVIAQSTHGFDVAQSGAFMTAMFAPVADAPELAVAPAAGVAGEAIPLSIALSHTGATEVLSLLFTGLPDGARLSAGVDNGDGSWSVPAAAVEGLAYLSSPDHTGLFEIGVAAGATEPVGQDFAVTETTLQIDVQTVSEPNPVGDRLRQTEITGEKESRVIPRPDPVGRLVARALRSWDAASVQAVRDKLLALARADAAAAMALAQTFDRVRLAGSPLAGKLADREMAIAWYRTAVALGSETAQCHLDRLVATPAPPPCDGVRSARLLN